MKVKICGITRAEEVGYLNESGADYAGFVFHPPSRRNVTAEQAEALMDGLDPKIRKVAVAVSPEISALKALQSLHFDVLQLHGSLTPELLAAASLPVWCAVNVADPGVFQEKTEFIAQLPEELRKKIVGIVVDGAEYGGGKTFAWEDARWRKSPLFDKCACILAGGLHADNVSEGIRLFSPDIVDVSTGVEGETGKDPEKIKAFIGKVRNYE
ncbi:MAG: phosphoribosylanthranilate isomerase [Muribaculaceae bacterium]|nr:phosphoribosylanthranilate isomerase [Roseburia sp.]MCM1430333.1 phosphoribosylanthranilate isomerase [Muribaculaceae bacterium]MCM1492471.1 phosphoribosylanthranilate isomerase [Muribaculaceae bacterium]